MLSDSNDVTSCGAGAAEEDRNGRPAYDPGASEEGGGDQTLGGAKQSERGATLRNKNVDDSCVLTS